MPVREWERLCGHTCLRVSDFGLSCKGLCWLAFPHSTSSAVHLPREQGLQGVCGPARLPLSSVCCARTGLALVRMCVYVCILVVCVCIFVARGCADALEGARPYVGWCPHERRCALARSHLCVCACVHVDASDGRIGQSERQEPVFDLLIPFPCKPLIPGGAQASSAGRRAGSGFKIREPHGLWGLRRRQPAAGAEVKFGEPSVVDWNSQADRTDPSAQFLPKPPRQAG